MFGANLIDVPVKSYVRLLSEEVSWENEITINFTHMSIISKWGKKYYKL